MKKNIISLAMAVVLLSGCTKHGETQSTSEDVSSVHTNAFEEYSGSPEFSGITLDGDAMPCPSINNKRYFPQMLCYYEETVYFSNPRDGLKLYSFDGKETKCLTDIPAMSPFYRGGEIYFLSSSADYIHSERDEKGRLYKYCAESGETVLLSDIAMRNLLVDENGIYYCVNEPTDHGTSRVVCYKFDEESGSSEKISETAFFQRYGKVELIFAPAEEDSDVVIYLKNGEETYRFLTGVIPAQYGIWNGKFYYVDQNSRVLYSIDLTNGTREEFGTVSDYAVLNGDVYYLNSDKLYKMGNTGDLKIVYSDEFFSEQDEKGNIQDKDYHYLNLYTTGSELYALVEWYSESGTLSDSIARITVSENGDLLAEFLA